MKYFLILIALTACAPEYKYTIVQAPQPLAIVKFCAESTSYPSTFPEVGFCIEGQLYAVYSANDGFLTLIPPGQYRSNAIGSACNFTVSDNCVIVR